MEGNAASRPSLAGTHQLLTHEGWNDMGMYRGCSPTKPLLTFSRLVLIVTCIKLLLIPAYRSTDFEVHRNWLAITHSLPLKQWYFSNTSEWTLDYPPLFAYVESSLSNVARLFDPEMLKIDNLNYASPQTVLFQRLSVIALDAVLIYAVYDTTKYLSARYPAGLFRSLASPPVLFACLSLANPGLFMVDHIHFQYNGFLLGILTLSVTRLMERKWTESAFYFSVAVNLKHIFLYMAPAFGIYMFRQYCWDTTSREKNSRLKPSQVSQQSASTSADDNIDETIKTRCGSFHLSNFLQLAFIPLAVTGACFVPFVKQMPQILQRLFPFKRGLTHAYWAPNFWAFYNAADKVLAVTKQYAGRMGKYDSQLLSSNSTVAVSFTSGLVQEYEHAVLPNVSPAVCLCFTVIGMLPSLIYLWNLRGAFSGVGFVRGLVGVTFSSFLFGWHVHEKAILYILLPAFILLAVMHLKDAPLFLVLQLTSHYSLFPLLFEERERPLKYLFTILYTMYCFNHLAARYCAKSLLNWWPLPLMSRLESAYVYGFVMLETFNSFVFPVLLPRMSARWPFLPLMFTSVYCAVGMFYVWIRLNLDMLHSSSRNKLA